MDLLLPRAASASSAHRTPIGEVDSKLLDVTAEPAHQDQPGRPGLVPRRCRLRPLEAKLNYDQPPESHLHFSHPSWAKLPARVGCLGSADALGDIAFTTENAAHG
jgi:hypothetical protein